MNRDASGGVKCPTFSARRQCFGRTKTAVNIMWTWVVQLVGAGAIGLAAVMLVLSQQSYKELLKAAREQSDLSIDKLTALGADLRDYRRSALQALVAAVVVQLSTPILNHYFPPDAPSYEMALSIEPSMDDLANAKRPVVKHEGRSMAPEGDGSFVAKVNAKSNFSIGIHGLREAHNTLQRLNVKVAQEQSAAQLEPQNRQMGLEPPP